VVQLDITNELHAVIITCQEVSIINCRWHLRQKHNIINGVTEPRLVVLSLSGRVFFSQYAVTECCTDGSQNVYLFNIACSCLLLCYHRHV